MKKLAVALILTLGACGLQGHEAVDTLREVEPPTPQPPAPTPTAVLSTAESKFVDQRLGADGLYNQVNCGLGEQYTVYVIRRDGTMTAPRCYIQQVSTTLKPGIYVLDIKSNTLKPQTTQSI